MQQAGIQGLVIVGAGPAGLAPLFAAASQGELQELLNLGVTLLERGETVGRGSLGRYAITSDSTGTALLDIVRRSREPELIALQTHPLAQAIGGYGEGSVPLQLVGAFLEMAGTVLCRLVAQSKRGRVLTGVDVIGVQQTVQGIWRTRFVVDGQVHLVRSVSVVLATGAHQPEQRLEQEEVAGTPLVPTFASKVVQSGDVLTPEGLAGVARRLSGKVMPRVAIVGGSTSAAAAALALLTRLEGVRFGESGITLLHRRPLRIFYETVEQAHAEGYREFTPLDVCPVTGRVFRLSGFRLDSRELMMRCLRVGGRPAEPRVRLFPLPQHTIAEAQRCLQSSDLIVAALGYRPRLLPVFDPSMNPVELTTPTAETWSVVDPQCRVVRADGHPLQGLFAIGLAVGPGASRELGGEAGFRGQVNSLWLWQHTLGARIARQAVERARQHGKSKTAEAMHPALTSQVLSAVPRALPQTSSLAGAA